MQKPQTTGKISVIAREAVTWTLMGVLATGIFAGAGCSPRGRDAGESGGRAVLTSQLFGMTDIQKREARTGENPAAGAVPVFITLSQDRFMGVQIDGIEVGGINNANLTRAGGSYGLGVGGSQQTGSGGITIVKKGSAQIAILIPDPATMTPDKDGFVTMTVHFLGKNAAGETISDTATLRLPADFAK
ncbi:Uncharacterised protein [Candidatus Burarchaeum australiense]|nr:Uncharacterised protein [Candidatus Burarchaeum australiense]